MDIPCNQYYGIDLNTEGDVVVAEDVDGQPRVTGRYSADDDGISALRRHIGAGRSRRRICVRCGGASALNLGLQLIPISRAEVMFVAAHALQPHGRRTTAPALATAEQRAQRLAVMARRML